MTKQEAKATLRELKVATQGAQRMNEKKCTECGRTKNLKQGWTRSWYCCESCERRGVSRLHGSMPGAGPVPRANWVPHHIAIEIERRWQEVKE